MQIVDLRIENFRGISRGRIQFGTHSVFIGPNGCGKTTIIEALALLFGRDRMVRSLTEHDFFGSNPQPADRIRLLATITNFENDDPAEHSDWFRDDRAVPKWWDSSTGMASPTREDQNWRLACQIGFCARFNRQTLEVETIRYFHDDDEIADVFIDDVVTLVPIRLVREIGFFLVPASRTWDRVVSFGSELFRRVVAVDNGQPAESVLLERDRLRSPQQPLEIDARLAPIVTQLNAELAGFLNSEPQLQLRVTTTDSDGLLEVVIPHYQKSGTEIGLPARRHGSGLISLQHLLLLMQFGRRRAQAGEGFLMALEEPELHVPPPLQRRLVNRIQSLSTQTFVSTHSPMVAAFSGPETITVIRNHTGELSAVPFLQNPLPAAAPNSVRKLFQLNRMITINALMHDIVLVPEGRIDYEWLHLIARAVDLYQGWNAGDECRFGIHIGIIQTHDAAIEQTVDALFELHPSLVALTDGDHAGTIYSQELAAAARSPAIVLRWPDNWMIEDVVGWVLNADAAASIAALAPLLTPPPRNIADLVVRLKSENRAQHGLKQDQVAYEHVADVIGMTNACAIRARDLLNAITESAFGRANNFFRETPGVDPKIRIFQP